MGDTSALVIFCFRFVFYFESIIQTFNLKKELKMAKA